MSLKKLSKFIEWDGFRELQWLLYTDAPKLSKILNKYRSSLPYIFQEIKFFFFCIKYLRWKKRKEVVGKIIFYNSFNQYSSLSQLIKKTDFHPYTFDFKQFGADQFGIALEDLLYIFVAWMFFRTKIRRVCKKKYYFHQLKPILYFLAISRTINIDELSVVLHSNDHRAENRVFLFFQSNNGTITVYKQHAQISEYFPPLTWSHSVLDGQRALDLYGRVASPRSQILLAGNDKTKVLQSCRSEQQKIVVGVALNELDDLLMLANSLNEFCSANALDELFIRPHPADSEEDILPLLQNLNSEIVVSVELGTLGSFLQKITVCISGESSVLLEAAIAHKLCVQHSHTPQELRDYYGFLSAGLAIPLDDIILKDIHNIALKDQQRSKSKNTQYFSHSFGTSAEGEETELILGHLNRSGII